MRPKSSTPASSRESVTILRDQVIRALADGVDKRSLVLHLTARDDSALKRHPDIAISEIEFKDGETHFMGIRVEKAEVSQLQQVEA